MPRARIVFGGSFDPVHLGHLALAEFVQQELAPAEVIFMPAGHSPFKREGAAEPFAVRRDLLRRALSGSGFRLDDREGRRPGPSWTVTTLEELSAEPGGPLHLLMGEDNLAGFSRWHRPQRILELARLVVLNRPGAPPGDPGAEPPCLRLEWPAMALSSSWLRGRIAAGRTCRHLLPGGVWDEITARGLYGARQGDGL
jgi:nicotinate-nucleotide adenylyltransferase